MISKECFCKALRMIREQEKINDQFSQALLTVGDGHFVFGSPNKFYEALMMVLKEAAGDKYRKGPAHPRGPNSKTAVFLITIRLNINKIYRNNPNSAPAPAQFAGLPGENRGSPRSSSLRRLKNTPAQPQEDPQRNRGAQHIGHRLRGENALVAEQAVHHKEHREKHNALSAD